MRITSKGQVTIPVQIRRRLALWPETEVEFIPEGDAVFLRKVESGPSRGRDLVRRMRGRASVRMTTEQILALTRGDGDDAHDG